MSGKGQTQTRGPLIYLVNLFFLPGEAAQVVSDSGLPGEADPRLSGEDESGLSVEDDWFTW